MNLEDEQSSRYDLDTSLEHYQENESQEVFAQVIENYVRVLCDYNVTLDKEVFTFPSWAVPVLAPPVNSGMSAKIPEAVPASSPAPVTTPCTLV